MATYNANAVLFKQQKVQIKTAEKFEFTIITFSASLFGCIYHRYN